MKNTTPIKKDQPLTVKVKHNRTPEELRRALREQRSNVLNPNKRTSRCNERAQLRKESW
jgi:hypothetical protein